MSSIVISLIIIFSICILQAQNSSQKFEKVVFDSTTIEQINTNSYPCITCEIIQSIYKKHYDELKHYEDFKIRKPAVYTEEEQIVFNILLEFMNYSVKDIYSRIMDSSFIQKTKDITYKRAFNEYDFLKSLLKDVIIYYEHKLKEQPFENSKIYYTFLSFLDELKNCPNQFTVSYDITLRHDFFLFDLYNKYQYIYLDSKYNEPISKAFPYGEAYKDEYFHINLDSYYLLGKNFTTPCTRAYSIYKWDKSNLQSQRWIRMK